MESGRTRFAGQLRRLLISYGLGTGLYRWFRDTVADDRYLRRWMSAENLPGEDNWRLFCRAMVDKFGASSPSLSNELGRLTSLIDEARDAPAVDTPMHHGHSTVRRNVQFSMIVTKTLIRTATEIELESLADDLRSIHHGIVISDASDAIDLRDSHVSVRAISEGYTLHVVDTFPARRTFQLVASLSPSVKRGCLIRYAYEHRCPNYLPLTRDDIIQRIAAGTYHLSEILCEKSYTVTVPTGALHGRIRLPSAAQRIGKARLDVALWKSDVPNKAEMRRLSGINGVITLTHLRNHDEIKVAIPAPSLHSRYRILWSYE